MSAQPASRRWCVTSATVPVLASTHGSAMAIAMAAGGSIRFRGLKFPIYLFSPACLR
jgi:hypothetical protein